MKKIICIIGPSGSGKTTLGTHLKTLSYLEIISHSTRKPRIGESEGNPYYFVSDKEFDRLPKIESVTYAGNRYCVSRSEIKEKFKQSDNLFVVISDEGYRAIKESFKDCLVISIYIYAPLKTLEKRMRDRGSTEEEIKERIQQFITYEMDVDYDDYDELIISGDIEGDFREVERILEKYK